MKHGTHVHKHSAKHRKALVDPNPKKLEMDWRGLFYVVLIVVIEVVFLRGIT